MIYKFAFLLLAYLFVVHDGAAGQQTAAGPRKPAALAPKLQPNPVYSEILPTLQKMTRVPLRLPAYLPYDEPKPKSKQKNDEDRQGENLTASIVRVDEQNYSIQLAFGKDCTGAHVCRDGGVTGSTVLQDEHPERRKVPVRLHRGIRGSFVDSECGAYCDESVLYWSEHGYHYSISSKAASEKELIRLANSAIDAADAQASADAKPRKQ